MTSLTGNALGPCAGNKCAGGTVDGVQMIVACCQYGGYVNNSVDYQNALNQAVINLSVVQLLNTGVAYTGADGKQYTFGYWNDTPLPGTTMAWQVYVWSIIPVGGNVPGPVKLYFNPQGAFPLLPIGGRKFTVAANQMPGDTLAPGYPLSVDPMVAPPGVTLNYEIQSAFCVSSSVRFGHPNAVNYSAQSSVLVPDPYIFGSIVTEAPPQEIVAVGFKGEYPFDSGSLNIGEAAAIQF